MTAYEQHLLGLAVEKCADIGADFSLYHLGDEYGYIRAKAQSPVGYWQGTKPTLAEALAALLSDLDVEVPEWPTTASFFGGLPLTRSGRRRSSATSTPASR